MEEFQEDVVDFIHEIGAGRTKSCAEWAEANDILIDIANDLAKGAQYREHLASHEKFWDALLQACLRIHEEHAESCVDFERTVLRSIRNGCIECSAAQIKARHAGSGTLHKFVAERLRESLHSGSDMHLALEAACNLTSGCSDAAIGSPLLDSRLILSVLGAEDSGAQERALVWTIGLARAGAFDGSNIPERSRIIERIFMLIFSSASEWLVGELPPDAPPPHSSLAKYAIDWVKAIILRDQFQNIFHESTTYQQGHIMKVVMSIFQDIGRLDGASTHLVGKMDGLVEFFVAEFAQQVELIVDERDDQVSANIVVALLHLLEGISLHRQSVPFVKPAVRLLGYLHQQQPRATLAKGPAVASPPGLEAIFEAKKVLLLMISQLLLHCSDAQNALRDADGIPLILEQCNYDENHPYLREYGIYCLRNALGNNPENQRMVEAMRAVDISPATREVLLEAGVDAERARDRLLRTRE